MEDVDRLAHDLVHRNRQVLLQAVQCFARRPVEVAQDQLPVAEHGVARQRIQRILKAAIRSGSTAVREVASTPMDTGSEPAYRVVKTVLPNKP